MPLKTETIEEPKLNLTPMIDVVFLLIIFFMVGTRFAELERRYDIQLPTVTEAQPLTDLPDEITVNIRPEGQIEVNGHVRTLTQLEADLRSAKTNYPDQAVLIRGDGNVPYQTVMDVLTVCKRAKIHAISLANRLETEDQR